MNKIILYNSVMRASRFLKKYHFCWILVIISVLCLRLYIDQADCWNQAEGSLSRAMYSEAIMYLDRVCNNYLPLSPYNKMAIKRLDEMGSQFLSKNELELALLAFETLRSSLYLTRHFHIREKSFLMVLDKKIADVRALLLLKNYLGQDIDTLKSQQIDILTKDYSINEKLAIFCVLCFFMFICCCLIWINTGRCFFFFGTVILFLCWTWLLNII